MAEWVDFCPICGKGVTLKGDLIATPGGRPSDQHRCNPRVLSALDAVCGRDDVIESRPTWATRFKVGCLIHELAGDD